MAEKVKQMYTPEGYKELVDELNYLKLTRREEIKEQIAVARSFGDLSENAEYDAAREAQGMLEAKIAQLELALANSRIIDTSRIDTKTVQILTKVTVLNHNNNKQFTYTLVSEKEANFKEGKIALGTPIAKALLGKKKGEIAIAQVPAGEIKFEILDISI